MCFSASASFGAGIAISVIGVASIKKVQVPSQYFFASIPLIFAVQQISEGFLWLALTDPGYAPLEFITTYTFLFFAQVVWPFWIPFSMLKIESEHKNKTILKFLLGVGVLVSSYLAFCLFTYDVQAEIIGKHVYYHQYYPDKLVKFGGILYVISTIFPPYFSSIKKVWFLSVAIFISYIISTIFYKDYIISVWCFFAAIISVLILFLINQMKISQQKVVLGEDTVL